MSGFPLLDPPLHLVERIISKAEPKSNFRLRQTCHAVNDLIQASPNIVVHELDTNKTFMVRYFKTLEIGYMTPGEYGGLNIVDFAACSGTRLKRLHLPNGNNEEKYNEVYEILKKNRITCDEAHLWDGTEPTREQCQALMALLKPTYVQIHTIRNISLLEGVCHSKTLKRIEAWVPPDKILTAMEMFAPRFTDMIIRAAPVVPNKFDMLRNVLEGLPSRITENLKKFCFYFHDGDTSRVEMSDNFPGLQWTRRTIERDNFWLDEIFADYALPQNFPEGSSCKILVERKNPGSRFYTYNINYKAGDGPV